MKFERVTGWGGTYVVPIPEREIIEFFNEKEQIKRVEEVTEILKQKIKEREQENVTNEHVAAILHELKHSRVKHPDNKWPWKSFDFVHQVSVMAEEAGEAVREANKLREKDNKANLLSLYNELAQTGAMCVRIMEQIKEYANCN